MNLTASGATFDVSGISASSLTIGSLSGAAGSTVALGGKSLTVGDSTSTTFAGAIGGTGGLAQQGVGTLTFTGAQTYTGSTIISGGTLALASGASLASPYIKAGFAANDGGTLDVTLLGSGLQLTPSQKLGGYGTVLGNVTIAGGAIMAPGGSIGTLTNTGTETWGAGGRYLFEITNATGAAAGTNWDLLNVTALSITATSGIGNQFVIDLQSLTNGTDQSSGPMSGGNWDPNTNYQWKFLVAGATTFSAANFSGDWFTVNTDNFQNTINGNGSFYVARGGGDGGLGGDTTASELYVVYAAVPEPGSLALAGIGLAAAGVMAMRRRRRVS